MYKLKNIVGFNNFASLFIHIISQIGKKDYIINVLQETVCSMVNQIIVGNFAYSYNVRPTSWSSDSRLVRLKDLSMDKRFRA